VATRKISDLTLLGVGEVSSSDTLLLLDNSDPTDQNKRSAVGSIFTAIPSGTYTAPGVRFEGKTSTGVFSSSQGQVGLALGNSRLNLQKVGTTLNIEARDDADQNLDFKLSAQGTGKIRLGSVLAINDLNFIVPNSVDETKVAKFSSVNLTAGLTNVYSFPSNEGLTNTTDELVTLKATQTLENKTIVSPSFTGTLTVVDIVSSGSTTLGDGAADSLTVNAAATFAASTTFANTLIINQGATITGDLALNNEITLGDDKYVRLGADNDLTLGYDSSADKTFITSTPANGLQMASDIIGLYKQNQVGRYFYADSTNTIVYHNNAARITTSATGINIGGAIDAVTSITGSGDITIATDKFTLASATGDAVFGGNITGGGNVTATAGTDFQLGSTASAKLGIGRAATTYNLEVEGSIYSTGSTIIAGNGSAGKFILQKGAAAIGTHFTNNVGTDEMVLDSNANLGIGKSPSQRLDVSGNANVDGNLVLTTTDPSNNVGGQMTAREIVLVNPLTGQSSTLDANTTGGVSRARVFFTNM
jgi:hypothetical protein